ncbi:NADP-dependent oxidoreductase [Aspergillus brunneoviolaceus CBS 621.78]|uniref:NAD(P)-binding protein n=1 Tax=Aspergillus brunneoviolaceus CBS 621.78 TaxID=1450534 RepID=A0ACD1GCV0_9EURO|nr:NAD(P)-binding protein [Aspergillus brunneoviolaceus CBS 621.78]RAH47114.1 NAD(P)-binding protein [Aspergillus brunneoviolaceus CBS 621.78]
MSTPTTMRKIVQPDANAKTLTLTTAPVPTIDPAKGEHLIQVKACAPCAGELLWPKNFPPPNPRELIPCPDVAGTVVAGPKDSPFQPGDEIYARTNYLRPGNARDSTVCVTDEMAHAPKDLSAVAAAAIPVSAETAWQILFIHAGVAGAGEVDLAAAEQAWKGKRVLVTAASGGVGIWVTQLATLLGAEVVGTCGAANVELVRSFGAVEVLDYRRTGLRAWAEEQPRRKVDVVVDCIGRQSLADAWWAVKDGGVVLSIFQPPEQVKPDGWERSAVRSVFFVMEPVRRHLEEITKLVELGKCRGMVDSVWPLEQYQEAFKRLDEGHARGKIVFDLSLNL